MDPVIVEEIFNASLPGLWRAITSVEEMVQWYFPNLEAFRPEVGFETKFVIEVEDRTYTHVWKVTRVIPGYSITYRWQFEEYPGDSFVTFDICKHDEGSRLRLTADMSDDLPSDIPEFTRESCQQGWNYFIRQSLARYLEGLTSE